MDILREVQVRITAGNYLWDIVDGEGDMPSKLYRSLGYFGPAWMMMMTWID